MSEPLPGDRPLLCVSDLHLTSADTPAFTQLSALAELARRETLSLALLGDLVEVWIGDDDDAALAQAFRHLLTSAAQTTAVALMLGNRDFLYGERLEQETGASLLPDPYLFDDRILLSHGDAYCTDDQEYQQLRALFRSAAWQADVLGRSLEERRALATGLRAQSEAANANKAANIMDVNHEAVALALQNAASQRMLHGHTHRPAHHYHNRSDAALQRFVLGAWEHCAWIAVIPVGGEPALFCLGLEQPVGPWWSAVKAQLGIRS